MIDPGAVSINSGSIVSLAVAVGLETVVLPSPDIELSVLQIERGKLVGSNNLGEDS